MTGGIAEADEHRTVGHQLRLPPVTGHIASGRQVPGRKGHPCYSGW